MVYDLDQFALSLGSLLGHCPPVKQHHSTGYHSDRPRLSVPPLAGRLSEGRPPGVRKLRGVLVPLGVDADVLGHVWKGSKETDKTQVAP